MRISDQTSRGGEATSNSVWSNIPRKDLAALFVAMRSIQYDGKEALEAFDTDTDEHKITVKFGKWNVIYEQRDDKLMFQDLRYIARTKR